jgi:hypothetical protein
MSKLFFMVVLAVVLMLTADGCATKSGSRQYTPGQGWQQN